MNDQEAECKPCIKVIDELASPPEATPTKTQASTPSTPATPPVGSTPNQTPPRSKKKRQSLIPSSRKVSRSSQKNTVTTPSSPEPKKPATPVDPSSPSTPSPENRGTSETVLPTLIKLGRRKFAFDGVFGPDSTQQQVYEAAVGNSLQQNLSKGYNTTILCYGQTGSGKTYTMHESEHSILTRSVTDLFLFAEQQASLWDLEISLYSLELLQEQFTDLLAKNDEVTTSSSGDAIKIRNLGEGGVVVEGATQVRLHSATQAMELVTKASERRATSSTNRNAQSSRSHAIYSFLVKMQPKSSNPVTVGMSAKVTLIDLAGSEQLKKSGVKGDQKRESIHINKDLFVLGKVVSALADKEQQSVSSSQKTHVPYRDSKLTQFLQDSLGGE